jgi:hypothetical protein
LVTSRRSKVWHRELKFTRRVTVARFRRSLDAFTLLDTVHEEKTMTGIRESSLKIPPNKDQQFLVTHDEQECPSRG